MITVQKTNRIEIFNNVADSLKKERIDILNFDSSKNAPIELKIQHSPSDSYDSVLAKDLEDVDNYIKRVQMLYNQLKKELAKK